MKKIFAILLISIMLGMNTYFTIDSTKATTNEIKLIKNISLASEKVKCYTINANTSGAYSQRDCDVNGCPVTACTSYSFAGHCLVEPE